MIAVDTNILVYAHRHDSPWHDRAYNSIRQLAEGKTAWAIPWTCVHEFFAVVTHPKIYGPPTPVAKALEQLDALFGSPSLALLAENEGYYPELKHLALEGKIVGPQIYDGRIAAVCLHHGVRELWSADRDFSRYPGLTVRNPLVG